MADVAPQHLLLAQLLALVLLRIVVKVLMNDRATTILAQLRGRHRRAFQVTVGVFHAAPGTAGLFGKVDLSVPLILRLQVAPPLLLIANVTMTGQGSRVNAVMAAAQQTDNGDPPDFLNGLLFFLKKRLRQTQCLVSRPPRVMETWMCGC